MKENQNIEWKETWRDEYIKWICGFANAAGGTLVIGKNNKGDVTGVEQAEKLMADIPNKVRDIMGIIVDVNLKRVKGKEFLEIMVEPHPYPVSYKGQYHYRSGSTKQELKASAFFRAGYIEAWGRGIEKINDECKLAGVPVPELNYDYAGLMITFQSDIAGKTQVETLVEAQVETKSKTPALILHTLNSNPVMTLAELADRTGKSLSSIERAASRLVKEGRLLHVGPKKGGYWKVQGKANE